MGQTLDSSSPIEYTTNISRLVRSLSVLTVFWRTGEEESNVCPTTYSKPDQAWALNPEALRRIQRDLSAKRPIKFYSKGIVRPWINSNAGDYRDRALTVKHFL